ncbi:MAG: hypothetical protein IKJ06_01915 [Clostridia bacterium]|nr:hypothetical protein [Clostridia bacterium]
MFREQYKGAYNEIKGNRKCIDKIFADKKNKVVPFRFATTLAVAMIAVMLVVVYPDFTKNDTPKEVNLKTVNVEDYKYPEIDNTRITSGNAKTKGDVFNTANVPAVASEEKIELDRAIEADNSSNAGGSSAQNMAVLENGKVATVEEINDNQEISNRLEQTGIKIGDYVCVIDETEGKQILYTKQNDKIYKFEFFQFSQEEIKMLLEQEFKISAE